ncbi:MAG: RnfABCDGE type electron transport complex subunit D [Candidatus Stahlbacteria bacterium]|nr:RnfABCDGE type electron transport complex subunit D [Candidatus Stahlbacteria bacterium]
MKLIVSAPPHIHKNISISRIMYTVVLALVPTLCWAVYLFGLPVLYIVIISCVSAIATEALAQIIMKRKITALDGSALLTGLLLAFILPPNSPFWLPVIGSVFAILIVKQVFGGLGCNLINPALAGRALLVILAPKIMSNTPIIGNILLDTKCISEVAVLLIGGLFLIKIKYIDWRIPLAYIGTVGILTEVFYLLGITKINGLFHILVGGLVLGAFFMATDYVTSPITRKGRCIFGIGCGIITAILRIWLPFLDGMCYAILVMNCLVPLIDRMSICRSDAVHHSK